MRYYLKFVHRCTPDEGLLAERYFYGVADRAIAVRLCGLFTHHFKDTKLRGGGRLEFVVVDSETMEPDDAFFAGEQIRRVEEGYVAWRDALLGSSVDVQKIRYADAAGIPGYPGGCGADPVEFYCKAHSWEQTIRSRGITVPTESGDKREAALEVRAAASAGNAPLRAPAADGTETPEASGPVLNEEQFVVRFRGKTCFLGNTKGFHLLRILVENRDRYVSRSTLVELVWDQALITEGAIESVVTKVRKALRAAGLDELLIDGSNRGHYQLTILPTGEKQAKNE